MTLLIITHVKHYQNNLNYFAYGPYVGEMNIWLKYVDSVIIVAPLDRKAQPRPIDLAYTHSKISFLHVPELNFTSIPQIFYSLYCLPSILGKIVRAMHTADHIHLRCPGNMGLLGCVLQLFFPNKKKTAKYAGNWDWESHQPRSYRIQQRILRSTLITRNMRVMVYGEWPDRNRNIKPFFTASYSEKDKNEFTKPLIQEKINLIFVGTLTPNKRPLLALQVLKELINKGLTASVVFCGDGIERERLEAFAVHNHLDDKVQFLGNVDAARVKKELQNAHFLVFGSQSEGWPKAVAEAMWWGCLPVTTPVSCVPQMLDFGNRGIICEPDITCMTKEITDLVGNSSKREEMAKGAMKWARQYTLEQFDSEISALLKN